MESSLIFFTCDTLNLYTDNTSVNFYRKIKSDKFYTEEGRNSKVVAEKAALFLQNLGLQPLSIDSENGTEESSEIDNVSR